MTQSPLIAMDARGFDKLMSALDVTVSSLERAYVDGSRALIPASNTSVVCFCEGGEAWVVPGAHAPVLMRQGNMLIGAAGRGVELMAASPGGGTIVCGYFRATFGSFIDVFCGAGGPIVEVFDDLPGLSTCLATAVDEWRAQQPGAGAMVTSLLKQVIIAAFRQCMKHPEQWSRRFLFFRDPQIARAFGEMAARPGAPHTVTSLASLANLSRSAFMARFSQAVGRTPMAVLRDLRMHRAAGLLASEPAMLDHVIQAVGYGSRSGFVRAFRQTFGRDPLDEAVTG